MDYFNEDDDRRFNFGLDKFFEMQEGASDFEITAFLNGSKVMPKRVQVKDQHPSKELFIQNPSKRVAGNVL